MFRKGKRLWYFAICRGVGIRPVRRRMKRRLNREDKHREPMPLYRKIGGNSGRMQYAPTEVQFIIWLRTAFLQGYYSLLAFVEKQIGNAQIGFEAVALCKNLIIFLRNEVRVF